jgi:hypothetical protein
MLSRTSERYLPGVEKGVDEGVQGGAERNTHIVKRFWRWLIGSLGIGGVIALCVFCPAVIPLLVSLMSWVVGKVPSLAAYFGVVSKKAFDVVVPGVGEFRRVAAETKETTRLDEELLKATNT